jgi:prepilin peptidase CpaA
METMHLTYLAVAIAVLACITDVRSRRIPNVLTFGATIAAVALHVFVTGAPGLVFSATGWLVGTALFFPFFALGGLGGGDVKLLGAIGACLGVPVVVFVGLYSAVAGGVLAVAVAMRAGYLRTALRNIYYFLTYWKTFGLKPIEGFDLEHAQAPRLAYALPVLTGLLVTLWLQ